MNDRVGLNLMLHAISKHRTLTHCPTGRSPSAKGTGKIKTNSDGKGTIGEEITDKGGKGTSQTDGTELVEQTPFPRRALVLLEVK